MIIMIMTIPEKQKAVFYDVFSYETPIFNYFFLTITILEISRNEHRRFQDNIFDVIICCSENHHKYLQSHQLHS